MGIYETMKDTVSLIQKVDNIDLYRKVLDLQMQVVALVDENRSLKERLSTQETLVFRKNSYWAGDDGPLCSQCWDASGKLIRLHQSAGFSPVCPTCNKVAVDPDIRRPSLRLNHEPSKTLQPRSLATT